MIYFDLKTKRGIGMTGESIAAKYLSERGFKILKRNYREKFDEIDIVAESRKDGLIFFEVKTMLYQKKPNQTNQLLPEDNFTKSKYKKTKRISMMFSAKHRKMI